MLKEWLSLDPINYKASRRFWRSLLVVIISCVKATCNLTPKLARKHSSCYTKYPDQAKTDLLISYNKIMPAPASAAAATYTPIVSRPKSNLGTVTAPAADLVVLDPPDPLIAPVPEGADVTVPVPATPPARSSRSDSLGVATKITSVCVSAVLAELFFVVSVEGPRQLIGGVANGVSTILSSSRIGSNTVTDTISETTSSVEEVWIICGTDAGFCNASEICHHTATKLLVRRWREWCGNGIPVGASRRTIARDCVGWSICGSLGSTWRDFGDLSG